MPIVRNDLQSLAIQTDTWIERRAVGADNDRRLITETTAPGFVIPQSLVREELSNWQGERTFSATGFDRELIEQAESYLKRPFYVLESSEVMSILSLLVNKDV